MAVTKQAYTAAATWDAVGLASIFRSAFIDAGYMTEWHDSFSSSGIENRVLEVVYDSAKAFGRTYYWFKFTTTGVWIAWATGWNVGTHVPTGTVNLDHTTTTTNATTGHFQYLAAVTNVSVTLTRYTSADAGGQTWFLLRSGATVLVFTFDKAGTSIRSFLDLDKYYHCGFHYSGVIFSGNSAKATFSTSFMLRRSYPLSMLNAGATGTPGPLALCNYAYGAFRLGGSGSSWANSIGNLFIGTFDFAANNAPVHMLPLAQSASNPAFAANKIPICTGLPFSHCTDLVLPSDIGVIVHHANNTMVSQDKFIVAAGSNEWEILGVANSSTAGDLPSIAFAARTV